MTDWVHDEMSDEVFNSIRERYLSASPIPDFMNQVPKDFVYLMQMAVQLASERTELRAEVKRLGGRLQ